METLVTASQAFSSTLIIYFLRALSAGYGTLWSVCFVLAMSSTAMGMLLGCIIKDPGLAVEFLPVLFLPQILFSGFFLPPDLIPDWLRWLQYIFPLTYAVKLIMIAEFADACNGLEPNYCIGKMSRHAAVVSGLSRASDLTFRCFCCATTTQKGSLNNIRASRDDTWWYWIVLCSQFVVFRLVALLILRLKASRFY
jgi:hypothetical protein